MTEREKGQLKSAIEKKKDRLDQLVADFRKTAKQSGTDNVVGSVSTVGSTDTKAIGEATLRKYEEDLAVLDRWLSLYGSEMFATCSWCGNEINFNRMLIMPASTRCVKCAGK